MILSVGENRASSNFFHSDLCSFKSVEYLKLLFISLGTAIFLMVVGPTVLVHDVSARDCDMLMGIAVFLIG